MTAPNADLNSLAVFQAVADTGGFTQAAQRLGLTKARASILVRRLEQSLGTSLFHRTTRRVVLSERGRALYSQCQPLLDGLQQALSQAGGEQALLKGSLRIGAPLEYATQVLAPLLGEFARQHPQLSIDLRASDHQQDFLREGLDLTIRIGWLRDSTLRMLKLGEFEQWLVAAPEYLQRRGVPTRPAQLAEHDWVSLNLLRSPLTWKFQSGSRTQTVRMRAQLQTDSPQVLRALVLGAAGISVLPPTSLSEDLAGGRLQRLLPQWQLPRGGIYAVFPPGRHLPAAARTFVEFLRSRVDAQAQLARKANRR